MIYSGLQFIAVTRPHNTALSIMLKCTGKHATANVPVCAVSPQSIDPSQQFTWEHSNLEVNKPKNRYANVIAYDHTRVILAPIEGEQRAAC